MFTGLVEDIGEIAALTRAGDSVTMAIAPAKMSLTEVELGDSIAIDGTCLTVTAVEDGRFQVVAGAETLRVTTLGDFAAGTRVNLERAMQLGDRLGGHIVSGHVDAVGSVRAVRPVADGANVEFDIAMPAELLQLLVPKGSITVDGISLTVNRVDTDGFGVALIPHTLEHTTLGDKSAGAAVNLEVDLIGKYVQRLLAPYLERSPT